MPTRRIPQARWGAIWIVVGIVTTASAIGLELFVRGRGYRPSIKDDEYAWTWERIAASRGETSHTVAMLGASRILLALDPTVFRDAAPGYEPVMLAINGTTSLGTLRDLARDVRFHGIVLADVDEHAFYREALANQDAYLRVYHRRWREPGALAERWLATAVQSRLALLNAGGTRLLGSLFSDGAWPAPRYVVTHADRSRYASYALVDAAKLKESRDRVDAITEDTANEAYAKHWLDSALEIEPHIDVIQRRGGKVVYLRMITCDVRWASDERMHPRTMFWDRLARQTHATAIHFRDEPTLASFSCPDSSHIDSKDGPRFTRALVEILRRRGVIAR